jgi:hypothetical protein
MERRCLDLLAPNDPAVGRIWRALEAHAHPSYFLSWGWISNWLAALPDENRPSLAVIHDGHEPSAAFFLAQRRVRRNLVMQSNALYFNATGSAKHDDLGIANNGMLAAPGARRSLAHVLDMLPADWDELHVPALDSRAFDDLGAASPLGSRYKVRLDREALAPYVDLDKVRTRRDGYAPLLPVSVRERLERERAALPPIEVEVATDRHHALAIYGELHHLNRDGAPRKRAASIEPWIEAFHRRLIVDRFPEGEMQLLRITSAGMTIGCLYNVVYRGCVHAYQAGFASPSTSAEPALISYAAAVEYNARAGHATYDVAEEALATGSNRLVWLTVQRPVAWMSIEDTARRWYEAIVGEREREPELQVA